MKHNMRDNADFIESVAMGIGISFSGDKKAIKLLEDMRK